MSYIGNVIMEEAPVLHSSAEQFSSGKLNLTKLIHNLQDVSTHVLALSNLLPLNLFSLVIHVTF